MATQEREASDQPEPPEMVVRLRRRREAYVAKGPLYKAGWVVAGLAVLVAGLAMLVLPGPALVVIPIGLAMLSLQFSWAEKLLERALERAAGAGEAAKSLSRRQKVLLGLATVLGVACVVALGVYLWVVQGHPRLRLGPHEPTAPQTDVDREKLRSILATPLDSADLAAAFAALVVDAAVADQYGAALAHARSAGRIVQATDLLIIATAAATGRELVTLDVAQAALARELGLYARAP